MFEEYTLEQKQELLRLSRIRIDIETKVPREKAIDSIVEKGIYGCMRSDSCSSDDINKVIASLGLMNGLRRNELTDSLDRLRQDHKIQKLDYGFVLSQDRAKEIESEIQEANRRLDTIVDRIYAPIIEKRNKPVLSKFFLEFISVIFAHFGEQWIKSLCNEAKPKDFLKETDIESIFIKLAKKHGLAKAERESIKKLTIKFFEEDDPDYNYLKFNLSQSIFITKILGVDSPIDLFSQEIFCNSIFYLDTNIIFASLLPVSRHNTTFKELLRICKKIKVELCISSTTKNEVEKVAFYLEKEASNIFDEIPEGLIPKIRGTFFESYIEEKKKNPNFCVADLFRPFHNLKEALKTNFSIDIIDSIDFDEIYQKAERDIRLQNLFNSKSLEIRKRGKGKESLYHDIFHYLLIEKIRQKENRKAFLITLDTSLPYVAMELQADGESIFCFKLDVLMQCFSPFITSEDDIHDFSEVFSRLIANQLFPSSKLFDIRDFVFFNDIGVKIKELPESDLEEALTYIKKYVLRGRVYTHNDFMKVAYEVKKLFAIRADKDETIRRQLDRISEMEQRHKLELLQKEEALKKIATEKTQIVEEIKLGNLKKDWHVELFLFFISSLIVLGILVYLTGLYAEGKNILQKIVSFWVYYTVWAVISGFCLRLLKAKDKYMIMRKENERK